MAKKKKSDDESEVTGETLTPEPEKAEEEAPKKEPKKAKEEDEAPKKKGKLTDFETFAAKLTKKWGNNIAIASEVGAQSVPRISFGNIGLDIATAGPDGRGGVPQGRMTRLWGSQKSAKTGTALNLVAEWQKHCSRCYKLEECNCDDRDMAGALYVDTEGRTVDNPDWITSHGISLKKLILNAPPSGEQVVDCIDAALRDDSGSIGLIILDSIANVVSSAELGKAAEDGETIGRTAKLMNSALRKWTAALTQKGLGSKPRPTIVCINQLRSKVDLYGGDTMPGGRGLDFATSLDIKFRAKALHYIVNEGTEEEPVWSDKAASSAGNGYKPKADDQPDYIEIDYKVTESSVCPKGRFGTYNYWLRPVHGHRAGDPDNASRIFEYAKNYNLLERSGRGYALKHLTGSTQDAVREALYTDPKLQAELWAELLEKLKK